MNSTELSTFLRENVTLFKDFPEERLLQLIEQSHVRTFECNEAVIRFGEENRYFFVIIKGEAEISVTDDSGRTIVLSRLSTGEIFGEVSLMTGDRAIANVTGVTLCKALFIPDVVFTSTIASYPPALRYLSRSITTKTAEWTAKIPETVLNGTTGEMDNATYGLSLTSEKPLKILVVNCGSSSLKYSLFDTTSPAYTVNGSIENIGLPGGKHRYAISGVDYEQAQSASSTKEALTLMLQLLIKHKETPLSTPEEISCVGHRVVHGGNHFTDSVVIDDEVISGIEAVSSLAPLHNPKNIEGIKAAMSTFPHAHHVAVFDTAFHHTLPPYAYLYGLPYEQYESNNIRRYGFHGTSHHFVGLRAATFLKRPFSSLEIISCHLGNGASLCAIDHGRSIDTSMGFTPTAGLLMGTRCGDIDPGILPYLQHATGMTIDAFERMINRESGLLGLSGISSDMRVVSQAADGGNHRALLAVKIFAYHVRKTIGAYVAAMQGLDAVIFTGGIGQGSASIRGLCCQGLSCMGITIDQKKNRGCDLSSGPVDIANDDSPIRVLVVRTHEELMIARETISALRKKQIAAVQSESSAIPIPIEVSAHHVHLSEEHIAALFGPGHTVTPYADLSQPGQFACKEQVTLVGPKGSVNRVRILGPARKETQIEISMTEQFKLGIHPPIRESGDLADTPGITLRGSAGEVTVERGVICAMRHIHMTPLDAFNLGVRDKYLVRIRVEGDRELVFGDVLVRVSPNYKLAMHIDTDEANAAHIATGATGFIEAVQESGI